MVRPLCWPDWLEHVWAKSAGTGEGGQPESLAQHTWYVLERLGMFGFGGKHKKEMNKKK